MSSPCTEFMFASSRKLSMRYCLASNGARRIKLICTEGNAGPHAVRAMTHIEAQAPHLHAGLFTSREDVSSSFLPLSHQTWLPFEMLLYQPTTVCTPELLLRFFHCLISLSLSLSLSLSFPHSSLYNTTCTRRRGLPVFPMCTRKKKRACLLNNTFYVNHWLDHSPSSIF